MASDELILARTSGITFSRDGSGHLEQPERLYAPFVVRAGGRVITCAFRDHVLSDLIGFTYATWAATAAADDLIGRLVEAGRRFRDRTGGGEAFIPIILDGENAWEHFDQNGRPFLRALYARLQSHSELQAVTMSEGCAGAVRELAGIFPGSWIDGNFYIWIGHADDQKAWSQLADARAALNHAVSSPTFDKAKEEVLIAEGSDWCWWYGDDHSSPHDHAFDELYRRHLRNAYQLMDRPIPDELFVSNIGAMAVAPSAPTALLRPQVDGEVTSYFEWLGAGSLDIRDTAGAMHQIERSAPLLNGIRFGFDRHRLLVRLDARQPMEELLAGGYEVSLKFLVPSALRFSIRKDAGALTTGYWRRHQEPPYWRPIGVGMATVGVGSILELALPFADLEADASLAFFVAIYDASSTELERYPADRPIELALPDELFEARHWRA
jgi:hypothetical protein